jgi:hypothetical protein
VEVWAVSSLPGEYFMDSMYGQKMITESRILQRGKTRSEQGVAWIESLNVCVPMRCIMLSFLA